LKDLRKAHKSYNEFEAETIEFLCLFATVRISRAAFHSHIYYWLDGMKGTTLGKEILFEIDILLYY
jgi:hypothetical protein